jgi:hypothetical protein
MKKIFISTFCILVCFIFSNSFAGDIVKGGKNEGQYFKPTNLTDLSAKYFNPLNSLTYQDTLTREQKLAQLPGYKLPKRALLFSALIPGAGELYTKSYIKAGTFFLAEVVSWVVYGNYTSKGNKQEEKFQNFADEHWDPEVWLAWRSNYQQGIDDAHDSTMVKYLSGDKTATTEQQFYEMIGKYPAFLAGWDFVDYHQNQSTYDTIDMDSMEVLQRTSTEIGGYMDMRDKSNKFFRLARTATNYVIVNHILSAIDAAWTAKRKNNRLLEASIKVEQVFYVNRFQPVLSLQIKW